MNTANMHQFWLYVKTEFTFWNNNPFPYLVDDITINAVNVVLLNCYSKIYCCNVFNRLIH